MTGPAAPEPGGSGPAAPRPVPLSRTLVPLLLACALLVGATGCGGNDGDGVSVTASPSGTSSAQAQKFAKARFVSNAGLAAGATYQWIVKPYRAGKFKKGADGRTFALVKAGLAGAFTYNRLKAAAVNAKGDPLLSKAIAPLTAGIESLKDLGAKLRRGEAGEGDIGVFESVINSVKDAGASAGAEVKDKVPSTAQLGG
ncbi:MULTISPECIES: hypothetical protein [unclassified Streptomyces]|uniref:hypothetical protein n=1 Tax=unclassified Streptomyces TaxID=2593676 RepID=UPI0011E794A3|nr:hypothetical protein [Streptomyces sp. sk2.1]TXS78393.1 hypothetical protein EAO76_08315 [Streptomyces sp. sk2.1]